MRAGNGEHRRNRAVSERSAVEDERLWHASYDAFELIARLQLHETHFSVGARKAECCSIFDEGAHADERHERVGRHLENRLAVEIDFTEHAVIRLALPHRCDLTRKTILAAEEVPRLLAAREGALDQLTRFDACAACE